jgi:hypothetical protein
LNDQCEQKNLVCEIFIHVIYITIYMTIPIALILLSISRTCLITLHIKKRFRTPNQQQSLLNNEKIFRPFKLDTVVRCNSTDEKNLAIKPRLSSSFLSTPSTTTTTTTNSANCHQIINCRSRLLTHSTRLRRRRTRVDTQMIILISINVAPFIIVHVITEIAYLFEKYSAFVAKSKVAQLFIIIIYLSWYLISATRFYTNCLLSRIYREEFKTRLYMLRHSCKPKIIIVGQVQSRQLSSRFCVGSVANGVESTFTPTTNLKSFAST